MTIRDINMIFLRMALVASFLFAVCADVHAEDYSRMNDDAYVKNLNIMYKKMSKYPSDQLTKMGLDMFRLRQQYDSAAVCLAIVKNRYKKYMSMEEKKLCIRATSASGYLSLYHYSEFSRAYDCMTQALKMSEETGIRDENPRIYHNLGVLFLYSSYNYNSPTMLRESVDFFEKGMAESYEQKDWDMYVKSFLYLSSMFYIEGSSKQLKGILEKFKIDDIPDTLLNHRLAHLRVDATKAILAQVPELAIKKLEEELKFDKGSLTPERYHTQTLALMSTLYEQIGDYDKAISTLENALVIADQYNLVVVSANTRKRISELYHSKGDDKNFALYYGLYAQAKDSLFIYYRMDQVGEKHMLASLSKAIDMEKKTSERRKMFIAVSLVMVVFTFGAVALALVYRRKNKYLDERNKLLYDRYHEMIQTEIFSQEAETKADGDKSTAKYRGSSLSDEDKMKLVIAIKEALNDTEAICKQSFTVDQMAQMIGSNSRYVSQVINECFGMNFNSLVAEKRVREACRMLDDEAHYGRLTIEAVAQNVGFKSRNSLIAAFKKVTGLTPSEYQKMSKE